tara:strand:- start:103 stop:1026 length:924 start_codon:yes stop_codon:yes gene_type:complete
MKKLLGIVVLGLLLSGNAYAASVFDYLNTGMSKKEFRKVVDGGSAYGNKAAFGKAVNYNRTKEIKEFREKYGWNYIGRVFRNFSYSKYFPESQMEILSHTGFNYDHDKPAQEEGFGIKRVPDEWIYYVFENVTKPSLCNNESKTFTACRGTFGDGTFKTVVFNKYDALMIVDPTNIKKYEAQKNEGIRAIVEKKEKEKKDAEKVKKVALEKTVEAKQSELAPMINSAKSTCKTLGFEEGTDKFTDCALKLYTQEVENKVAIKVAEQKSSNSSNSGTMTIYDPVRDSQNQIDRGMKMLSGGCTLGIDC